MQKSTNHLMKQKITNILLIIIALIVVVLTSYFIAVIKFPEISVTTTPTPKATRIEEKVLAKTAALSLSPQEGSFKEDESFTLDILMDTHSHNIVVGAAILNFDPKILEAVEINDTDSVLTMSVIKEIRDGEIEIIRGIPGDSDDSDSDDGFTGSKGLLAQIKFKALSQGEAEVIFNKEKSKLILDNGKGTPCQMEFEDAQYEILGAD